MENEELIKKIFEYAKQRIKESDLRNIDRTAQIFFDLLEELEEEKLSNELYDFYKKIFENR